MSGCRVGDPAEGPAPRPAAPAEPQRAAPARQDAAATGLPGRVAWRRVELPALLELVALCGLAIAQPLLDVTGKSPDFFLFYGAGTAQILLLVGVFALVPPLALWGIGLASALAGRRVRAAVQVAMVGALLVALAVQVGKHLIPVRGLPLALLAVLAAAAATAAYVRWSVSGQVLRVASVGPLVFVLLFVFASPASAVVLPGARSGAGPGAARKAVHPPIVMLLLDEFPLVSLLGPDGSIDAQRFPNFARLASGSTWYRNATAVSGWTPYAVPAMLTGRYPTKDKAPHYSQYPDNLFTLLGGVYDLQVQESITELCPPRECGERPAPPRGGLPVLLRESAGLLQQIVSPAETRKDPTAGFREATRQEAASYESGSTSERAGPTATTGGPSATPEPTPSDVKFRWDTLDDNQPARFTQFVAGLKPSPKPTLHFLHLLLPHTPWNYLPSGIRYDAPEDLPIDGAGWGTLARQRHLAQLEYTDRLLGETLRALKTSGLFDKALVIVTADHGLSFTPGAAGRGVDPVTQRAATEMLWVPLFVKAPGQRTGKIDDRNWEHVDLLPTIADYAGVEVPWRPDGIDALRETRQRVDKQYHDDPSKPFVVAGPPRFAAITHGAAQPAVPAAPLPELIGRATADLPVSGDGPTATVRNLAAFDDVNPGGGSLPALVLGTLPKSVPNGTLLAIAVNGRIGAVVPVAPPDKRGRRFAGLVADESLFRPGANRLELYEVTDSGTALRPLRL